MKKNKVKTKGVANKDELEKKYVYLTYTEYRSGGDVCKGDEDSDWPCYEDTDTDWNLVDCALTQKPWPTYTERVEVDFDVKVGDGVWVVYVRYGTGDSFGRTNGCWKIIGVYKHQGQASKILKSIEDDTYTGYKCWTGYFESLESCNVEGFIVKE